MGQYWRLVDLDGRVALQLLPMKLGEGIWNIELHERLFAGGLRYIQPLEEVLREFNESRFGPLPPRRDQKQSRLLAVLPLDVLRLVFESFGPPDAYNMTAGVDAAAFALTCQMCLEVGHPVLRRHQAAKKQSWIGHRLIIAGDYQDGDDLPDGLEVDLAWREPKKNIYTETGHWPEAYMDLHDAVDNCGIFTKMVMEADSMKEVRAVRALNHLWWYMFAFPKLPRIVNPGLRNLNTKEYAREDVLEKEQQDGENGHRFNNLYLGDLALFRICWSSQNDVAMNAPKIFRGPWAGHRFDVVDFSQVDLEGWKDVSEELVAEVAKIFMAEFGPARMIRGHIALDPLAYYLM